MIVHPTPSQCSISVSDAFPFPDHPTAHTSSGAIASTPNKTLLNTLFGLGTIDQSTPFQCSTSVWLSPLALTKYPTAHISLAETASIDRRMLSPGPALGLDTICPIGS